MKNLLVGQSGGPTPVINASLAGVIEASLAASEIDTVFGAVNGIEGILNDNIISLNFFREENIKLLKQTPSSYLGACRKRLPEPDENEEIYLKIFNVMSKYNIGYFLYIGGNDSMDTVKKLSRYADKKGIDIKIIGIPKTIDNDLLLTDHTPGYASAAKFVVNAIRQLYLDTGVYDMKSVIVLEIMGRNVGWLTASAALANSEDLKPVDIICLPEVIFDKEKFLHKLKSVLKEKNTTIIAVSEGIKDSEGNYITKSRLLESKSNDGFSHAALGGVGKVIENIIASELDIKTRSIELSTLQRCFSLLASETDVEEAFELGVKALHSATAGKTGIMMGVTRKADTPYSVEFVDFDIDKVANFEKGMPEEMISADGLGVTDTFIEYAKPLIKGEMPIIYKDGMIQFEVRK